MLHYNNENMVQQEFPFPAPIMDYIFKNITASQLLKLYQTCKFFYDKFGLNIIEDFEIGGIKRYERVIGNSLAIYHRNPAFAKLRNLWISNSFTLIVLIGNLIELDVGIFSRLTYDKLSILGSYSIKEYEFLVEPPTLRHLIFGGNIYRSTETDCLSIEDHIELVPHISTIDLSLYGIPPPLDMSKLISMERKTKITSFHLDKISQIPDPVQVVEFFMKHGTPDIDYYFGFTTNNADDIKAFYKTVNDGLLTWKHSLRLPPTISSSFIDLTGKTAVITGAADGIGRATVIRFRQLGASVIAFGRQPFELKTLVEECQNISTAGFLHTISLDTSVPYSTNRLLKRINYKFGTKFDVLVNIADTSRRYSIPNLVFERRHSHDLCYILHCHKNLIKEATPYLIEAKGCIINVSKPDGLITRPEDVDEIAELEETIKNAETELASSGVRINTVNSGTPSTIRPDGMNDISYKKYLQETKKTYEKEVANAIAFLASDSAKFIDGAVLPVNALKL